MGNRVFEDRVGLWIVTPGRGVARLPAIRAFGGGLIADTFWPRTSSAANLVAARNAGLAAHLWVAVDGRDAATMAADTLADVDRVKPGAVELNVELASDAALKLFAITLVKAIRAKRPKLRLRLNFGAWKGFGLPELELASDPNLYVCEQTYLGDMTRVSEGDVYFDLAAYGAPSAKLTLCYGAAGPVPPHGDRVCTLPDLSRRRRGVIFHDDLMADVGLL